ncbi:MAG: GNAT family N-acetyltransferase [Gammaproteobacteria bacterium]|nr:GNAT family N-acetyltransferase [Gammaproteobacteria bacterium]
MLREAQATDVAALNSLRLRVKQNILSRPLWLTEARTLTAITETGRGWVWEENGMILGFSVANASERNIWALFVEPGFEGRGIGRQLLDQAVQWLWSLSSRNIWLSTDRDTRAESVYRAAGWQEVAQLENGDIRFELARGRE